MEQQEKELNLYATNKAMFALWDARSFSSIKSEADYFENFSEDKDIIAFLNSGAAIVWTPSIDGVFKIIARIGSELTSEEKPLLHKSSLNHKLIVTGKDVFLGSPEWIGYKEQEALDLGTVAKLDLAEGIYKVDVYCLLRKTEYVAFLDYVVLISKTTDSHTFVEFKELPCLDIKTTEHIQDEELIS